MKKLILILVVLLIVPCFVFGSDLRITSLEFREPVIARTNAPINMEIENTGGNIIKTSLPYKVFGSEGMPEGGAQPLLGAYTGRHGVDEPQPIEIKRASGEIETVIPVWGEISYVDYDPGVNRDGEVINPQEVTRETYYIELNPGDIVLFDSTKTLSEHGVWIGANQLNLKEYTEEMNFMVYEEGSAEKKVYTTEVLMAPTVIQINENTYGTAYVEAGCVTLEEKEICILIEDKIVTFSVDDEVETYNLYGFFMNWLNKIFGDGAISDNLIVNGITLRLYEDYFTIDL